MASSELNKDFFEILDFVKVFARVAVQCDLGAGFGAVHDGVTAVE